VAQLAGPVPVARERLVGRLQGFGPDGLEEIVRDLTDGLGAAEAVDRLRLAIPEAHPAVSRLAHDHRVVRQIEQLSPQPQLLLVSLALGDVARRYHKVFAHRRDDRVQHPGGEDTVWPRLRIGEPIRAAWLPRTGNAAIDLEPVAAREVREPLPE